MHNRSRNELTRSARGLASLLAVFFVLTATAALVLVNLDQRAFDPGTYRQALAGEKFYQQFPSLLGDLIAGYKGAGLPVFMQHLSADQWRDLLKALLPDSQLQSMTEDALNQVLAYLNGEIQTPVITLTPLKESLAGPAGLNAAITIIRSQPDCTIQQIAKMVVTLGQEICNPPQAVLDLLKPAIQIQLQAAAAALPDSLSLLLLTSSGFAESGLKGLMIARLIMRLSLLIPLAFLLGITNIAARTLRSWLVWWGWPFLLTGLLGVPLGLAGAPLLRWAIERWLSGRITLTLTPEVADSLRSVADAALRAIIKPVAWESLALLLPGLIMLSISAYLSRREQKKPAVSKIRLK